MDRQRSGFAVILITGMLLCSRCAFSQIGEPHAMLALGLCPNVVHIQAQVGDQRREGFGFVVGEKSRNLYIVTAYHVVAGSPEVSVQFFSWQTPIPVQHGEVLQINDPQHDLAVLITPAPPGYEWYSASMGQPREQQRSAKLLFVGKSKGPERANWFSAPTPGEVESETPVDSQFEIAGLWAASGSEGGPVIGSTGIVGMIQTSTPDHTRALTIDFIQEAFQRWGYPWGLTQHCKALKTC